MGYRYATAVFKFSHHYLITYIVCQRSKFYVHYKGVILVWVTGAYNTSDWCFVIFVSVCNHLCMYIFVMLCA